MQRNLHVQQGAVSTCRLLPPPALVDGFAIFPLLYCPLTMGPCKALHRSFSWLFFPTIPFSTQQTPRKQYASGMKGMKVTYLGWNGSRRKLCQRPLKSCHTCWLNTAASVARGKNPFFSFKLWLEKSLSMNQLISHWLASLISFSINCKRNTRLLCRWPRKGTQPSMCLCLRQKFWPQNSKLGGRSPPSLHSHSFNKCLLNTVSTTRQLFSRIKKKTNKSPCRKTNTPVSCSHLELRGVSLKNAVSAEKPQVCRSPCSQHLLGPGLLPFLPCEFNIPSLLFFWPKTQHAFYYHFLSRFLFLCLPEASIIGNLLPIQ